MAHLPSPSWLLEKTYLPKITQLNRASRGQTFGGASYSKSYAPPLWLAEFSLSKIVSQEQYLQVVSWLRRLESSNDYTTCPCKCWPVNYPHGAYPVTWDSKATVKSINGFNVVLENMADGIELVAGDHFTITSNGLDYLYEIYQGGTSSGGEVEIEVNTLILGGGTVGDVVDFHMPRFSAHFTEGDLGENKNGERTITFKLVQKFYDYT